MVGVASSNLVIRSQSPVGWPNGEATACKAVYAGSIPVPTSLGPEQRACTQMHRRD